MDKPSFNVVIFDDDQQPPRQQDLNRYTSTNRNGNKPSSLNGHSSQKGFKKNIQTINQNPSNLTKQMVQLQTKIKAIEKQGQRLKLQIQKRGNMNNTTSLNVNNNKTTKQIQQILMIVEKKIQIIIQESKKLVNKMTETVERKLSSYKNMNADHTMAKTANTNVSTSESGERLMKSRLNQIQLTMKQKLEQCVQFYKLQYEKVVKQAKLKEQLMMKRLSEMELKFANRINAFQTKEKQYVDWIHHLEGKLKEKKTKKMITITQQKPQISPLQSKNLGMPNENASNSQSQQLLSHQQNNLSSANVQTSRANMSISDQNNSKAVRKHKIFGGSVQGQNKSVSPIQKKLSPTKDSLLPQKGQLHNHQQQAGSSFYQQPSISNSGNLNFYNELRHSQTEKVYQQVQSRFPQQQTQYRFADLNQFSQQYNESESDDFFAPIQGHDMNGTYERGLGNIPVDSRGGTYYKENFMTSQNNFQHGNKYQFENNSSNMSGHNSGQKVFSPFDLN